MAKVLVSEPGGRWSFRLREWSQPEPLWAEIVAADGSATEVSAPYDAELCGECSAGGILSSPSGSRLRFTDTFEEKGDGIVVSRTVEVLFVGKGDIGFSSRFSLRTSAPARIRDREFFMPGVWYKTNQDVSANALAADPDAKVVLVREDRLPLPLVMVRDPATGSTATLSHVHPDGATFTGEDFQSRIVDARMQFGSMGVINDGHLQLAFQFPGTEGDRTYIHGDPKTGWALRSHPLAQGFSHHYQLRLAFDETSSGFPEALQASWRKAFRDASPQPPRADLDKVRSASVDLLGTYIHEYNGVPSVPFQAGLPDGEVKDTSSQMGFVGKALPSAALLMAACLDQEGKPTLEDDGLRASRLKNATAVVDFWVQHSMNTSGVPKNWYNINTDGTVTWRSLPTHLRIASDGLRGVLDAWRLLKKPEWLAYCRCFGDFLVAAQEEDGSIAGLWRWDGTPEKTFKNVTDHVIPFLVDLYQATHDGRYRLCAIQAGEYSLVAIDAPYRYRGGAADNPNVMDKEAGVLALAAFLALHDLTDDEKWVKPAAQAGTFCETWTYAWDVPLPADDPKIVYPRCRTTLGASLIASGQSGADNFMASAVHHYQRLHELTAEQHFKDVADFLEHATKQLVDWDGALGYSHPGLLMEAFSLVPPRGRGVQGWLPWLTVAILEPMVRSRSRGNRPVGKVCRAAEESEGASHGSLVEEQELYLVLKLREVEGSELEVLG